MEEIELILKLSEIGWIKEIEDVDFLFDWLYRNFQISLEKRGDAYTLYFGNCILCRYYGIKKYEIPKKILPDITLLWKCKDGIIDGPSLDNFEEPEVEWT